MVCWSLETDKKSDNIESIGLVTDRDLLTYLLNRVIKEQYENLRLNTPDTHIFKFRKQYGPEKRKIINKKRWKLGINNKFIKNFPKTLYSTSIPLITCNDLLCLSSGPLNPAKTPKLSGELIDPVSKFLSLSEGKTLVKYHPGLIYKQLNSDLVFLRKH